MKRETSISVALSCLASFASPVLAQDAVQSPPVPDHYYVYRGERIPLELDTTRVAVRPSAASARVGLESHDVPGWFLADVPGALRASTWWEDGAVLESLQRQVGFVSPVFLDTLGGPLIVTPDVQLRFHPWVPAARRAEICAKVPGTITDAEWAGMPGALRLRSSSWSGFEVLATANALAELPEIAWAEPDVLFTGQGSFIPNDPDFPTQWALRNTGQQNGTPDMDMDAPAAWDITLGDSSIHVAIIDTGTQLNHPDLNVQAGIDTTSDPSVDGSPVNACDNHGTWVTGCVSAIIDNGIGVAGLAPHCISRPARTFISTLACNSSWTSAASWTVDTLDWAELNEIEITNNSNAYGFTSSAIDDKYQETRDNGMIHFGSAGNAGVGSVDYPANLPTVNALGMVNRNGNLVNASNFGPDLFATAPGRQIRTTDRTGAAGGFGGDHGNVTGTSFASPYASAVAALILSVDSTLTPTEVEDIMAQSAMDRGAPGFDNTFGWGIVNAYGALLRILPSHRQAPPTSGSATREL